LPPYEIILVLDPDEKLTEFYASRIPSYVKIVIAEKYGLSHARNAGVKEARGDIVAFIDDDAVADEEWLRNLVKNYDDPNVLGVGGLIKPVWENRRPIWFPEELDWVVGCSYKGLPEEKSEIRNPIGCNMSFRKEVFEKVGYFKSSLGRLGGRLIGSEEAEFSVNLIKSIPGSKIIYDPSAIVYHKVTKSRASLRYLIKRSFYEGVSKRLMKRIESNSTDILLVERQYVSYLLTVFVPSKLKRIYKLDSVCQLLTLALSVYMVLMGYFLTACFEH